MFGQHGCSSEWRASLFLAVSDLSRFLIRVVSELKFLIRGSFSIVVFDAWFLIGDLAAPDGGCGGRRPDAAWDARDADQDTRHAEASSACPVLGFFRCSPLDQRGRKSRGLESTPASEVGHPPNYQDKDTICSAQTVSASVLKQPRSTCLRAVCEERSL